MSVGNIRFGPVTTGASGGIRIDTRSRPKDNTEGAEQSNTPQQALKILGKEYQCPMCSEYLHSKQISKGRKTRKDGRPNKRNLRKGENGDWRNAGDSDEWKEKREDRRIGFYSFLCQMSQGTQVQVNVENEDLQDNFNVLESQWQRTDIPRRIGCDNWPRSSDWMPTVYICQCSPMSWKTKINSN